MDAEVLRTPVDDPPLGRSRAGVLDILRGAAEPVGVREVAQRTGLHQNTARFHLEALVEAGLASRDTEDRQSPGRPRVAYRASGGAAGDRRSYRLLAQMLASLISGTMAEPAAAAEAAGREWGAYLTPTPPPYQRISADDAIARLTEALGEMGFAPEAGTGREAGAIAGRHEIRLRQCPFAEVARRHADVICSLHLGLMQGMLTQSRAPLTAEALHPNAAPGLCVATFGVAGKTSPRDTGTQVRGARETPPARQPD
jgi:predicted ArsR family transcriptional regulator